MAYKDLEKKKATDLAYRGKNRERIAQRTRKWQLANKGKVAVSALAWYHRNKDNPGFKEEKRDWQRVYREENKEVTRATNRRSYHKNKDRRNTPERKLQHQAHNAINKAVLKGKMPAISTLPCVKCGKGAKHYHHESYDRKEWLNVIPLCGFCHSAVHAIYKVTATKRRSI